MRPNPFLELHKMGVIGVSGGCLAGCLGGVWAVSEGWGLVWVGLGGICAWEMSGGSGRGLGVA